MDFSLSRQKSSHALILAVFILLIFGVIMITSIGVPKSIKLSAPDVLFPNCSNDAVNCYFLLEKHLVRLAIGIVAFLVASKINSRFLEKISGPIFAATILTLIAVLFFGTSNNTFAKSWFNIYQSSIQPSEFAKLGIILYLSSWMNKKQHEISSFKFGFIPFCIITLLCLMPILLQPDIGSGFVIGLVCVAIYFVAGGKIRHLALGAVCTILIGALAISNMTEQKERIKAYLLPTENCAEKYCWQGEQANIAIGSGGIFGKGLTQGIQKSYWLPQASDDFIFAASAEELGFLRIVFIVLLYAFIGYQGYKISRSAPDRYTGYVAAGITTWIVFQAFINIGVNVSLFPITGITLPFVSYGGSSLVASLIGMGILVNISKNKSAYAHSSNRRRNRGTYHSQYRY